MSQATFVRQPLDAVAERYDRLARWYRPGEIVMPLMHHYRGQAVSRLNLRPGMSVLEIGCGTGRNFPMLDRAVGPSGSITGVDVSGGMLAKARREIERRKLSNATILQGDAATVVLPTDVDAVFFSYSYSALPDRASVLTAGWQALRPGGRLLILDAHAPDNPLGRLIAPYGDRIAGTFAPGDPYSRPWDDVQALPDANCTSERFLFDTYSITTADRAAA